MELKGQDWDFGHGPWITFDALWWSLDRMSWTYVFFSAWFFAQHWMVPWIEWTILRTPWYETCVKSCFLQVFFSHRSCGSAVTFFPLGLHRTGSAVTMFSSRQDLEVTIGGGILQLRTKPIWDQYIQSPWISIKYPMNIQYLSFRWSKPSMLNC